MQRRLLTLAMAAVISITAASMSGCEKVKDDVTQSSETTADTEVTTGIEKATKADSGILEKIDGQLFYYSSGAGAWATELKVHADGSFEGHYYDMDMGDSGVKNPNGTQYDCQFKGQFSTPEKVGSYSYSMKVEKIETEKKEGTQEIKNGIKYAYTAPAGISDGAKVYVYVQGTPVNSLPAGYLSWANMSLNGADKLPFYGIYNERDDAGFVGTSKENTQSSLDIENELAQIEKKAAAINNKLQNEILTQTEMNQLTAELYKLWDNELNKVWSYLKDTLDNATMSTLKEDERNWIKNKDSQVKEAGKEFQGGTMQSMVENSKAAELTRERVYELSKYASH